MYRAAKEQDADMVRGGMVNWFGHDDIRPDGTNEIERLSYPNEAWRKLVLTEGGRMAGGIIKRSIFEDHHLRYPEQLLFEDNAIGALLWLYCRKVIGIEQVYYYYRNNNQSTCRSLNNFRQFDRLETSKIFLDNVKKHGFYEPYKDECDWAFIRLFYVNTIWFARQRFKPFPYAVIQRVSREIKEILPEYDKNPYFIKNVSGWERFKLVKMMPISARLTMGPSICIQNLKKVIKGLIKRMIGRGK